MKIRYLWLCVLPVFFILVFQFKSAQRHYNNFCNMEAESVLVSIKKTGSFPTEEKIFDKSSELFFVVLEIVKEVEFGPKKEAKSYDSRIIIEFYEDTPFATYSLEIFDDGSHVIPIQFYKGKAEQSNSKGWFYFYDQKSLISKLKSAFE